MIVTKVLVEMARATARTHGLPSLHLAVVNGLLYGQSRQQIAEFAVSVAPEVETGLLRS